MSHSHRCPIDVNTTNVGYLARPRRLKVGFKLEYEKLVVHVSLCRNHVMKV